MERVKDLWETSRMLDSSEAAMRGRGGGLVVDGGYCLLS